MEQKGTRFFRKVRITIQRRFNLHMDKADEEEVITAVKKNSEFKGANLWTLIFAILIASIGLNVNSTAVIIGAMLISPLMGPIMGIGVGVAINDYELLKKGGRNLLIATLISIATSAGYFWLTPLHDAQSELLSRTTPSVWDVFIAFIGGLAGIIAGTRKEKSNVIPGVAIATALMPPLCTAGFGLANGQPLFFLGAIYLYFINSVFICISTFLIVRFLRFGKKRFEDKQYEKRISRYVLIITLVTITPSVFLAWRIVDKSIFENNAQRFVKEAFNFRNTQVVSKNFIFRPQGKEIDLLLIGAELEDSVIKAISQRLPAYHLPHTKLVVRQGLNAKQEIDLSQIKASILEDIFRQDSGTSKSAGPEKPLWPDLSDELKILFPPLLHYGASDMIFHRPDSTRADTVTVVVVNVSKKPGKEEAQKMQRWLKARLHKDSVQLILQQGKP
ncbi:TIGR00341 family protein [Chitinophaga vietnamensis]|uniref:TIGR00341 family protein n=1 Tax=Chitinophaga vietnamensis TaxID=2593957 RepID=UPI0011780A69|nr:TIGR00341 family protein [Chitinophaga vietnamensis]